MTLREYLQDKYQSESRSLSVCKLEAEHLGIHWPLRKGWLLEMGQLELSEREVQQLRAVTNKNRSYKKTMARRMHAVLPFDQLAHLRSIIP